MNKLLLNVVVAVITIFGAIEVVQKYHQSHIDNLVATAVVAKQDGVTCDSILTLEDSLKRHIYHSIVCRDVPTDKISYTLTDDVADALTPRQ